MFTLAHISDLHLGPLPRGAALRNFALKRTIGASNWRLGRHKLHDPAVARALAADILATRPDHVAITGDLVNVAAREEFPAAARWLEGFGPPDWITFVPGNHDTYVPCAWEHGLGHMAAYMTGDMRVERTQKTHQIAAPFPFVRLRKNVALIGLSSAVPQPLHRAGGKLGAIQIESARTLLRALKEKGYARVLLIHHPPLPGQARPRKALTDAAALREIIEQEGADLVLHGHNHEHMHTELATRTGLAHIIGVPSGSMAEEKHHPAAAWNLYRIARKSGKWSLQMQTRRWNPAHRRIESASEMALST